MRLISFVKRSFYFVFFLLMANNVVQAAEITFSWLPSQDSGVKGYKIYYGLSSRTYMDSIQVVPSSADIINGRMRYTVTGLENHQTYYVAITAYGNNTESDYSREIIAHAVMPTLIPQSNWRLQYVDSEELIREDGAAINAFDGDPTTIWHTEWRYSAPKPPHELQIDLGTKYSLDGFRYLPRQDEVNNGTVKKYAFYVSNDGVNWGTPVAQGFFYGDRTEKEIHFSRTTGRFVRFVALSEVNNKAYTSIAEINLSGEIYSGNSNDLKILSQNNWRLQYVDSEEQVAEDGVAINAFDGDPNTIWHTEWKYSDTPPPHELQIDLGGMYEIHKIHYLPRQSGSNGIITQYEIYVSSDGENWGKPVAAGSLVANNAEKHIACTPKFGRFIALVALNSAYNKPWTSVAEINVTVGR